MSELTTPPLTALAEALARVGGPANGNLYYSETEMLARIHTLLGAPVSHLTTSRNALLAGIRNLLSDGADLSSKTSSDIDILADMAGVSRLTHSAASLWDLAWDTVTTEGGGGEQLQLGGETLQLGGEDLEMDA